MTGVAFFVYRRPDYTERVIRSLKKNNFEKIYVFQDGYDKNTDYLSWNKVSELVRRMESDDVEVHISEEHKGLSRSVVEGMSYVFKYHETAIALEDDMYLADGYGKFMEACFEKYSSFDDVMCVSGASFGTLVPSNYLYDVFFSYRMSSAGFGTWRRYWEEFVNSYFRNPFALANIYSDSKKKGILDVCGTDIEGILWGSVKGISDTWAIYWTLYQIDKKGLEVIPCKAFANDIGHQGDGTNSKWLTNRYDNDFDETYREIKSWPTDICVNREIIDDTRIVISTKGDDDRFKTYYPLMSKWIECLQKGGSIYSFFSERHIDSIYIYGKGRIAKLLQNELENHLTILGYVVEQKKDTDTDVYEICDDDYKSNVPIVVTPTYDKEYILHLFRKYSVSNPIIWLEEVLSEDINA